MSWGRVQLGCMLALLVKGGRNSGISDMNYCSLGLCHKCYNTCNFVCRHTLDPILCAALLSTKKACPTEPFVWHLETLWMF